ncbi:uroporphyrinogen decarboxylase family protein [Desulfitobacterium sp.]|uniref:uroporphyrinogen decarboxylase family protein n=1 Tax=Desulfitobacterium sp. TaxID=49981 RepID=UPI002CBA662E|nr:uroporphyrinogen decarboxylase family protein [Desulfitobacterium sp.]HVJ47739.1 uroporphyrinogen decarboxylase family protein [Desulfitobacterium sp.]
MILDLNSREKVKRLIRTGKSEEVLKGELVIEDEVVRKALACEHVGFEEKKSFVESFGLDLITVSPQAMNESKQIKDLSSKDYQFPDLQKWVTQTECFTFAILDGAFERGIQTQGMGEFFRLLRTAPTALQEWNQAVEKLNLNLVQRLEAEGVDGIILADDVAYAGGLMVHPQSLKDHFMPSLARQVEEIKRSGLTVFYHSDGNYRMVLDDILQAGFDGLHCIDRNSNMEIAELQKEVGDQICLWGHLDVQDLEEVVQDLGSLEQQTKSIKNLASGHRFLLGTSSGLFEGMNIQGLKELYQNLK